MAAAPSVQGATPEARASTAKPESASGRAISGIVYGG